jgi:hypothetical protein
MSYAVFETGMCSFEHRVRNTMIQGIMFTYSIDL